jgi:hypothetical protein
VFNLAYPIGDLFLLVSKFPFTCFFGSTTNNENFYLSPRKDNCEGDYIFIPRVFKPCEFSP